MTLRVFCGHHGSRAGRRWTRPMACGCLIPSSSESDDTAAIATKNTRRHEKEAFVFVTLRAFCGHHGSRAGRKWARWMACGCLIPSSSESDDTAAIATKNTRRHEKEAFVFVTLRAFCGHHGSRAGRKWARWMACGCLIPSSSESRKEDSLRRPAQEPAAVGVGEEVEPAAYQID